MNCCNLKAGDRVIIRAKRSNVSRDLDGTTQVVYQHFISGEPMPGKHTIMLSPFEPELVVWGDEVERAP